MTTTKDTNHLRSVLLGLCLLTIPAVSGLATADPTQPVHEAADQAPSVSVSASVGRGAPDAGVGIEANMTTMSMNEFGEYPGCMPDCEDYDNDPDSNLNDGVDNDSCDEAPLWQGWPTSRTGGGHLYDTWDYVDLARMHALKGEVLDFEIPDTHDTTYYGVVRDTDCNEVIREHADPEQEFNDDPIGELTLPPEAWRVTESGDIFVGAEVDVGDPDWQISVSFLQADAYDYRAGQVEVPPLNTNGPRPGLVEDAGDTKADAMSVDTVAREPDGVATFTGTLNTMRTAPGDADDWFEFRTQPGHYEITVSPSCEELSDDATFDFGIELDRPGTQATERLDSWSNREWEKRDSCSSFKTDLFLTEGGVPVYIHTALNGSDPTDTTLGASSYDVTVERLESLTASEAADEFKRIYGEQTMAALCGDTQPGSCVPDGTPDPASVVEWLCGSPDASRCDPGSGINDPPIKEPGNAPSLPSPPCSVSVDETPDPWACIPYET